MQTGYDTMVHGGVSAPGDGGVRQTRLPHSDCRGIRNLEIVEKERMLSFLPAEVEIESSGT